MDPRTSDLRIARDPDFILLRRYGFSLQAALQAHPDGYNDRLIAQALGLQEGSVEEIYLAAVKNLQKAMKLSED